MWRAFAALVVGACCALAQNIRHHFRQPLAAAVPTDLPAVPTNLLGSHGGRRPGWGRDYGPNYNLPKEVSADPFKNHPTQKPHEQPLGEQVAPTQLPTAKPAFNHSRAVKSPTMAKEVTPSDEFEKVTAVAEDAAKILDPMPGGIPIFTGETCKAVCTSCAIAAAELPESETCRCAADCIKGPEAHICHKDDQGYTQQAKTKPDQEWQGFCSNVKSGDRVCSECEPEGLKYEIGNCTIAVNQATCLYNLRVKYQSGAPPHFCAQTIKHGPTGECLQITGGPEFGEDNGWHCFNEMKKCQEFRKKRKNDGDEIFIK